MISERKTEEFVGLLLKWFDKSKRDYPWRRTKDPYRILVAEIMLQRTKADQVAAIYEKFLERYPDPRALANASVEEIEKQIWALGLEKRAPAFKRIARELVDRFGGRIPNDKKQLLDLFWVGDYIANAIICHAYGQSVPTVDANFARVLKRVFSLEAIEPAQKDKRIWRFADNLIPLAEKHASELNLAVLDLGGNICTPRRPLCTICPLNRICDYYRSTMNAPSSGKRQAKTITSL